MYKLGKLPARHDPRTLSLAAYLGGLDLQLPDSYNAAANIMSWPMFANDRLGDCTIAAAAHLIELWSETIQKPVAITDDDVVAFYFGLTGGADNGLNPLDVLNKWRNDGLCGDKILGYAAIGPMPSHVKSSIYLFGGAYCGIQLPACAEGATEWVLPAPGTPGSEKGSWGGHCVPLVEWDPEGVTCITWGNTLKMSWDFWGAYHDECYGVIPAEWQQPHGQPFNMDQLKEDLEQLTVPE